MSPDGYKYIATIYKSRTIRGPSEGTMPLTAIQHNYSWWFSDEEPSMVGLVYECEGQLWLVVRSGAMHKVPSLKGLPVAAQLL